MNTSITVFVVVVVIIILAATIFYFLFNKSQTKKLNGGYFSLHVDGKDAIHALTSAFPDQDPNAIQLCRERLPRQFKAYVDLVNLLGDVPNMPPSMCMPAAEAIVTLFDHGYDLTIGEDILNIGKDYVSVLVLFANGDMDVYAVLKFNRYDSGRPMTPDEMIAGMRTIERRYFICRELFSDCRNIAHVYAGPFDDNRYLEYFNAAEQGAPVFNDSQFYSDWILTELCEPIISERFYNNFNEITNYAVTMVGIFYMAHTHGYAYYKWSLPNVMLDRNTASYSNPTYKLVDIDFVPVLDRDVNVPRICIHNIDTLYATVVNNGIDFSHMDVLILFKEIFSVLCALNDLEYSAFRLCELSDYPIAIVFQLMLRVFSGNQEMTAFIMTALESYNLVYSLVGLPQLTLDNIQNVPIVGRDANIVGYVTAFLARNGC